MFVGTTRHRQRVRTIRRLYLENEVFREIWDDYVLARKARRLFKALGNAERIDEYDQLCAELAQDIRAYIPGHKSLCP